jgi:ABC-2 type transport system ATP-binding protein
VLETGEPITDMHVTGFPPGSEQRRHWSINLYRVRSGSGRAIGIAWLGTDITARRAAAREAAAATLAAVGMTKHENRIVRGYSKGMRQRTKLAQALVHDPQVLFLDEPLTGTDPVARRDLMDIIQRLAAEGRSVLVSSHVLHEVQSLTPNIVLLNHGRLVAEGHVRDIRDLIDKYPHHIVLICDEYRKLAARLLAWPDVEGVRIMAKEKGLMVETRSPDAFYARLPQLSLEDGTAIREVYSDDDNLEAVFKYLVNK